MAVTFHQIPIHIKQFVYSIDELLWLHVEYYTSFHERFPYDELNTNIALSIAVKETLPPKRTFWNDVILFFICHNEIFWFRPFSSDPFKWNGTILLSAILSNKGHKIANNNLTRLDAFKNAILHVYISMIVVGRKIIHVELIFIRIF